MICSLTHGLEKNLVSDYLCAIPHITVLKFIIPGLYVCIVLAIAVNPVSSAGPANLLKESERKIYDEAYPLALQEDVQAMYKVGIVYWGAAELDAKNKEVFWAEAHKWFSRAAEKGHADAMHFLSDLYFWGKGLPRDRARSYMRLTLAKNYGRKYNEKFMEFIHKEVTHEQIGEGKGLSEDWMSDHKLN